MTPDAQSACPAGVAERLGKLAGQPPQSLLLEGGRADARLDAALVYAAGLNCVSEAGRPCRDCPACRRVLEQASRDLFIFDGRESRIKVSEVRALKPVFGEPPRGDGKRVVIFAEAQELTDGAANTLLKALEEPCPGTVFVMTAPHRERLLPTLVSRSWTLTLPWTASQMSEEDADPADKLLTFWQTGIGFFQCVEGKGAVDKDGALRLVNGLRAALVEALSGRPQSPLGLRLSAECSIARLRRIGLMLDRAEETLTTDTPVTPALALEWLAVAGCKRNR